MEGNQNDLRQKTNTLNIDKSNSNALVVVTYDLGCG